MDRRTIRDRKRRMNLFTLRAYIRDNSIKFTRGVELWGALFVKPGLFVTEPVLQ